MANEIKIKRGSGSDPGSSDLSVGELAIRTDTAKLFTKNDAGSVAEIGGGTDSTKMPLAGGTFTGDVVFEGTGTNITFDRSADDFIFNDGAKAVFGTGLDLQIYHTGSNSVIADAGTGQLQLLSNSFRLNNAANSANIITAEESGAVNLFFNDSKKFETKTGGVQVHGNLMLDSDNNKAIFGASNDLQIYHDGTNSYLANSTGVLRIRSDDLRLQSSTGEEYFYGVADGGAHIYHNNALRIQTTSSGVEVTGNLTVGTATLYSTGNFLLGDNDEIRFGAGEDLKLYHNGTHNYIDTLSNKLHIRVANGENAIVANSNGAVELYHNASKRLESTSTGIDVTGNIIFGANSNGTIEEDGVNLVFKANAAARNAHIMTHDGSEDINLDPSGFIQFEAAGAEKMRIVSEGVAIGRAAAPRAFNHGSDGVTNTMLEAVASDSANSIFESATFRGGADHNGAGARVRLCHSGDRGLVLEGGRTSNAAFGTIGLTDQNGGITSSVHINSSGTWFWNKSSQSSSTAGVELYKDGPNFITRNDVNALGINCQSNSTGDSMRFYFQDAHRGSLNYNGSTFQTITHSDYRLKENNTPIIDGITRLKKLNPIRFNWKRDPEKTYDGFIAHEVQDIVPEAVVGEKDAPINEKGEGYQMMNNEPLIPLLTAALKEAVSKIELLEAKVTTLEAA